MLILFDIRTTGQLYTGKFSISVVKLKYINLLL
jgi:hypothetical protein